MMNNRILVVMFASAFFFTPAVAGWFAVSLMMQAGPTPGSAFCMVLGLGCGSAWPDVFSKNLERSKQAGWACFFSVLFFFLSYCFSWWSLWVDSVLMFQ
jgi:hypothetical protein